MTAIAISAPNRHKDGWDAHVHIFDGAVAAQPGHYQPAHHPIEHIEAEAAQLGVGHLVLVQPSVYGTNNRLILDALQASCGRHRAVVVVDETTTRTELQTMHTLRELGWHIQWYAHPQHLAQIAQVHQQTQLPCVLDHLAGMHAALATADASWLALQQLAEEGAWVKLSGWYRLGEQAPYERLTDNIQRVAALAKDRLVWGSDWPHTAFEATAMPAYRSVWTPVVDALGEARAQAALVAGAQLYA